MSLYRKGKMKFPCQEICWYRFSCRPQVQKLGRGLSPGKWVCGHQGSWVDHFHFTIVFPAQILIPRDPVTLLHFTLTRNRLRAIKDTALACILFIWSAHSSVSQARLMDDCVSVGPRTQISFPPTSLLLSPLISPSPSPLLLSIYTAWDPLA
jgi:hypothetical protein